MSFLSCVSPRRNRKPENRFNKMWGIKSRFLVLIWLPIFMLPLHAKAAETFQTFLKPNRENAVVPARPDILLQLHVTEGDHVTKGQLLAEMDSRVLQAKLGAAQQAADSEGEILSARHLVTLRESKLTSLEKLEKRGNAEPQEVIAAVTSLAMAKAQLQIARDQKALRVEEKKVIEAQIEETKLYSPFAGVVVQVHRHEGELVGGGSEDPVVTLVQLDPLLADFHIPLLQAEKLKKGSQVQLQTGGHEAEAVVSFVSPVVNAQSNTIMVRMTLANPKGELVGGNRIVYTQTQQVENISNGQGKRRKTATTN